jgi:hypothetical protein
MAPPVPTLTVTLPPRDDVPGKFADVVTATEAVVPDPKSYPHSVAVAVVGVMLTMYGAAKSVIAAALRRKFWNAIVFFLALGDAVVFIRCRKE